MNTKQITIKNINDNGFRIGSAIKNKGTEIFSNDSRVIDQWGLNPTNCRYFTHLSNVMRYIYNEDNMDSLYVKRIRVGFGDDARTYRFHDKETADRRFSVKELFENRFENIEDVEINRQSTELHGHLALSKYKRDLDSQKQLMVDLFALVDCNFSADGMDTDDYDLDISDKTRDISGNRSGYTLVHGDNETVLNTKECEYIEGRPDHHNAQVDEDFWSMTYEECLKPHLDELDPKEHVTVYHRKGKDWYVGQSLMTQDLYITYVDDESRYYEPGDIEEETFYVLATIGNDEALVQKIVEVLNEYREDFSMRSYVENELDYRCEYNDNVVSEGLVELVYEDMGDLREDIMGSMTWEHENLRVDFLKAYTKAINEQININDDLVVEITSVPMRMATKTSEPTITKYNHLKLLKRLEGRFGYELVKTVVSENINSIAWAIKIGAEEYHFDIADVIAKDIQEEESLREFILGAIAAIGRRKIAKLSQKELFDRAARIFVGVNDSLHAGNCLYGTQQFISKHHIDTTVTGGIRGDVLLEMETSNFTKRAVETAIISHGLVA